MAVPRGTPEVASSSSCPKENLSMVRFSWRRVCAVGASAFTLSVAVPAATAGAQAYNYPSMQTPRASTRDYTAGIVGGAGTSFLFQWREGAGKGLHWQLDAGFADPEGGVDPLLFVGGGLGKELTRATNDQPLDVLFTAGVGAAFGGNSTVFRVPLGVSVGHTFELEQNMSLTPFVHPRLSVDACGRCGRNNDSRTNLSANFDVGGHWQVNRQFGVKVSASFSGSDLVGTDETVAIGFNWTPAGLARR
jgi:hypothetical protein